MGAEASLRRRVVSLLAPLDAMAVENAVKEGTPDVECIAGWIELKQLAHWPVHAETPVTVPKFRPAQRDWLRDRCRRGGTAWVLIKIDRDHVLLWGAWAAEHLGTTTRTQLLSGAVAHWPSHLDPSELIKCLTRHLYPNPR